MRLWRIALVIGLAAALVDFPRALEPGRSEQAGVVLNMFVDHGHGAVTNDWYSGGADTKVTTDVSSIRVQAGLPGYQLVSRQIAVFPNQCYLALARVGVFGGDAELVIFDGELTAVVTRSSIPITGSVERGASFSPEGSALRIPLNTGGFRRITLGLTSAFPAVIELSSVSIVRGAAADCQSLKPGSRRSPARLSWRTSSSAALGGLGVRLLS